jgi:hypothetical protein
MHRLKTENAGNAPGTPRKAEASDAQTLPTKPLIGTLHQQLVREACPPPRFAVMTNRGRMLAVFEDHDEANNYAADLMIEDECLIAWTVPTLAREPDDIRP